MICKKCHSEKQIAVVLSIVNVKIKPIYCTAAPVIAKYLLTIENEKREKISIETISNPDINNGCFKLIQTRSFKDIYGKKVFSYSIRNNKENYNLYMSEPLEWDIEYDYTI